MSLSGCFCQCSQGQCTFIPPYTSQCVWNTGLQITPGSQQISVCSAPTSGTYNLSVTLVDGNPPSNIVVDVNGTTVASANISTLTKGGSTSLSFTANQGDIITISTNWGYFYQGGTLQLSLTAPPPPTPTPTPPASSSPGPIPVPSSNLMLIIMAIIIAILVVIVVYLLLKSSSKSSKS